MGAIPATTRDSPQFYYVWPGGHENRDCDWIELKTAWLLWHSAVICICAGMSCEMAKKECTGFLREDADIMSVIAIGLSKSCRVIIQAQAQTFEVHPQHCHCH